jgi:hypothetical protein
MEWFGHAARTFFSREVICTFKILLNFFPSPTLTEVALRLDLVFFYVSVAFEAQEHQVFFSIA